MLAEVLPEGLEVTALYKAPPFPNSILFGMGNASRYGSRPGRAKARESTESKPKLPGPNNGWSSPISSTLIWSMRFSTINRLMSCLIAVVLSIAKLEADGLRLYCAASLRLFHQRPEPFFGSVHVRQFWGRGESRCWHHWLCRRSGKIQTLRRFWISPSHQQPATQQPPS